MVLVLPRLVRVRLLTHLVGFEEHELGHAFVRVDASGQGRRVADLEGHLAAPLGFEGGDVHDEAAAGVGAFAHADREDVARDLEVLDGLAEGEAVGRDDDVLVTGGLVADIDLDHHVVGKLLGVDDGDIAGFGRGGEDLEAGADADVVAVAGDPEGDPARALHGRFERLDLDLLADLMVRKNGHGDSPAASLTDADQTQTRRLETSAQPPCRPATNQDLARPRRRSRAAAARGGAMRIPRQVGGASVTEHKILCRSCGGSDG